MTNEHTFHVTEMFLLVSAFDGNGLFGLPDKKAYQLKDSAIYEKANQLLIEKGILDTSGKLTEGGVYVIRALELYYYSEKYVRIHNLMFGFQDEEEDELIMLMEVEEGTSYRLYVTSKALVLKLLTVRFPLIIREPKEEEKEFLKKEIPLLMKEELVEFEPEKNFMNLEIFHITHNPKESKNSSFYQQWLIFTKEDDLIMIDPVLDHYYYASQYWFLKVLFEEMDFPYKEEKMHG